LLVVVHKYFEPKHPICSINIFIIIDKKYLALLSIPNKEKYIR